MLLFNLSLLTLTATFDFSLLQPVNFYRVTTD